MTLTLADIAMLKDHSEPMPWWLLNDAILANRAVLTASLRQSSLRQIVTKL